MIPSSSEGLAAFDQVLLDACAIMRPPENLTVAEWADKYGMLSSEGSAEPGRFYISNAEYQREPLEMLSPGNGVQSEVLMWGSQIGKTQIGLFFVAYHCHHDPAPILFVEPTEDLAKVIVNDRIKPMIRDTPQLRDLFASRAKGKTDTFHMPFPGGQISMGWANSPSQLASRPIRILVTDEEGRYGQNNEGDPVDQARKRLATFKTARKHLRVSSPALRRTCRITKAYEQSDKRKFYVPCPHCGHMQVLRFENLRGTPEDCFYMCEANACVITEDDKYGMVRAGKWIAENPGGGDGRTAGYQLSALYSTIGYTWAEILADFRKCEGIPDKLQVFTNTVLAEPWDEQAEGADLNAVQKHAEEYPAQAPAWAIVITCGADVQKDRIEATKWGFGLNDVSGVIEHRVFRGDPLKQPELWAEFEEWRSTPVEHESGLMLPVACTFVDSGDGNRTQAVYDYTRRHERDRVYACKGSSLDGAPLVNRGTRQGKWRVLVVSVGTSTAKDLIYSRLAIEDKSRPGYIHFPNDPDAGCDGDYFKHLTAERLVTRQTKGGEVSRWENPQKRNEALDCAVYARAALEFTRAPLKELARKLAAKAARLTPADRLANHPLMSKVRAALQSLPSPESSAASPSPQAPKKPEKARRKVIRRPGFGWIHR